MLGKSFFQSTFILLLATIETVQSIPAYINPWSKPGVDWKGGRAVYFQTNEQNNSIVALKVSENGTLSKGFITSTWGKGASSISSSTNLTASPDGLSSQGSVTVVGSNLFAVNAGDNSVSIFSIDENDPAKLTLLGTPKSVPGDFPVTVAASSLNSLVCVGTSGEKSGISCAPYSRNVGIGEFDFLRPFDLNQTTPPVGPLNTVSQTYFSADESLLITTVKGDPTNNITGFVSVHLVSDNSYFSNARVSAADIKSIVNGTNALFGFQQIPESDNYFVADPSFGTAIITVDEITETTSLLHKQEIPNQKATCWVAISPSSNSAYVTDPMFNHIVELSLVDSSITSIINTTTTNNATGYIDVAAAGDYVYALAPGSQNGTGAEVTVLSVSGQKSKGVIQSFNVGEWAGASAQGLVTFP